MSEDERSLVEGINNKDNKAFDRLYTEFFLTLVTVLQNRGAVFHAEDAAQDAMIKLFRSEKAFESLSDIEAFLYVTAQNRCIDKYRHDQLEIENKERIMDAL
ncbi:MAG: hypothetical protein DI539_19180, partial [Flavobacterium psychrophilum]